MAPELALRDLLGEGLLRLLRRRACASIGGEVDEQDVKHATQCIRQGTVNGLIPESYRRDKKSVYLLCEDRFGDRVQPRDEKSLKELVDAGVACRPGLYVVYLVRQDCLNQAMACFLDEYITETPGCPSVFITSAPGWAGPNWESMTIADLEAVWQKMHSKNRNDGVMNTQSIPKSQAESATPKGEDIYLI